MNSKSHPLVWLLSGFVSCAILLTGVLWWRAGGNPFVRTETPVPAPDPAAGPPAEDAGAGFSPVKGAAGRPPVPGPPGLPPAVLKEGKDSADKNVSGTAAAAAPSNSDPHPAPGDNSLAEEVPESAPGPPPAVSDAPSAGSGAAAPDPRLLEAAGVPGLAAVRRFSLLLKTGALPRPQITGAAYQWGITHLPADETPEENSPFDQVLALLNTSTDPHERGMAAMALAGSGRSSEAMEAIQKARDAAGANAPEASLMDEALRRANEIPDPTPPGPDGSAGIRATPPAAAGKSNGAPDPASPAGSAPPRPAAAPDKLDRVPFPHEHEGGDEDGEEAPRLEPDPAPAPAPASRPPLLPAPGPVPSPAAPAAPSPPPAAAPEAPKTAPSPPPVTVIPAPTGGAGQTTILPPAPVKK